MRYLRTNEIVEPRIAQQAEQLRGFTEQGVVPQLLIARDEAGAARPDVRSYTAALRKHMRKVLTAAGDIGCQVTVDDVAPIRTVSTADLKHVVRDADGSPKVDSIIVMSPTERDYEGIVAGISSGKDVDGMNPDSGRVPCTPMAIQAALEHHDLWRPDRSYVLVGKGRTVNSHVDAGLRAMHGENYPDRVRVVTHRNTEDLPAAMAVSDVAIVAAGVRHQIRPGIVRPDTHAVVGVCIEDIHPGVYNLPYDVLVTPVHLDQQNWGIGANTSAIAAQRTFEAAAARTLPLRG